MNLYESTDLRTLLLLLRSRLNTTIGSTRETYSDEKGDEETLISDPIEADVRKDDRANSDTS
jgi:hypothetical protein